MCIRDSSNDFEALPNEFNLIIAARDGAGNTSAGEIVTINVTNNPNDVSNSFILTVGADTPPNTTNNDTYTGDLVNFPTGRTVNSLESVDVIDGGDGADTLNATLNSVTSVVPTLISVNIVNITNRCV